MSGDRGPEVALAGRVARLESALLTISAACAMAMLLLSLAVPAWSTTGSQASTVWFATAPFDLIGRTGISPRLQSTYALYGFGIGVLLVALAVVLWFLLGVLTRTVGPRLGAFARFATILLLVGSLLTLFVVLADAASAESFHPEAAVYLLPVGATAAAVVAWALRWLWSPEPAKR